MKSVYFINWTQEEFVGWWNGKPKKYPAGKGEWLPDYLASHYAKHLTNRELLRKGSDGKYIYEKGETMTSPKFPDQVPTFMELFNKAYHPEEVSAQGEKKDDLGITIDVENKNRQEKAAEKVENLNGHGVQIIPSPPDDEDESSFKH